MTALLRVSALFIHPVKSAAAVAVTELPLDEWGAENDRRWMLVDTHGTFLTQREYGTLALIRPTIVHEGLLLRSEGRPPLHVPTPARMGATRPAIVWEDTVPVLDAGNATAQWCSDIVGIDCRLVHISAGAERPLNPKYAGSVNSTGRHVALSDGAPLLILSEASLAQLNRRLAERNVSAVGWDRFRPNIVLTGTASHDEDTWRTIRIGGVTFGMGTPCPRCVITTIEQRTGRPASQHTGEPGGEPLRTLAQYRRQGSGAMFGMNVTNASPGIVRIGDEVTVLEMR